MATIEIGGVELQPISHAAYEGHGVCAILLATPSLPEGFYKVPSIRTKHGTAILASMETWAAFGTYFPSPAAMAGVRRRGAYLGEGPWPRWTRRAAPHQSTLALVVALHAHPNPIGWALAPAAVSRRMPEGYRHPILYAFHGDHVVAVVSATP